MVMNHSRIGVKPREGGHLAGRLTDSLRVSTEKIKDSVQLHYGLRLEGLP